MKEIQIDTTNVGMAISAAEVAALQPEVATALSHLHNGTGAGNDFIGWVDLPTRTPEELIDDIMATAQDMRERCDTVVCIGIGGSYLGAKAVIHALSPAFPQPGEKSTEVVFAGHNISEDYLYELQQYLHDRRFGIIVISKSGTTTEPAIAFRLLREQLEKAVGHEEAARRIVAITDVKRGALRQLATREGYKTYVIEDSVGGRFSVLTPVGLLPIAVAGHDIRNLVEGARKMQKSTININATNIAGTYAATRNALYRAGKKLRYWSTTTRVCTIWPNGGSSCTARARASNTAAYSPHRLTIPPTSIRWGNGYRTASALFSRRSYLSRRCSVASPYRASRLTLTGLIT